jgi:hypothetical protein
VSQLVPIASATLPALVAAAGERAGIRFLEFFAANIRNPHTRRAYARAADEFLAWCAGCPACRRSAPSAGAQHPDRGRHALARGAERQATARRDPPLGAGSNPAASGRGHRHVTSGKTPVLDPVQIAVEVELEHCRRGFMSFAAQIRLSTFATNRVTCGSQEATKGAQRWVIRSTF